MIWNEKWVMGNECSPILELFELISRSENE